MSLQEKLDATRAAGAALIPADKQAIMHRATEDLRRSGFFDRIVPVGAIASAFTLANHDGQMISSTAVLARGPIILSFFRGSW